MKRTLKRELKEFEVVKLELIEFSKVFNQFYKLIEILINKIKIK